MDIDMNTEVRKYVFKTSTVVILELDNSLFCYSRKTEIMNVILCVILCLFLVNIIIFFLFPIVTFSFSHIDRFSK